MDRVSGLPDEVLCHILSFLPTKHAALTSVLSKRWNNLWTLVPDLDIDDSVTTIHPEEGTGDSTDGNIHIQGFVAFVDRILALQRDSPIKKFSLKCITGVHPDCVNRWIRNVLQRGVSHLNLFIDFTYEDIDEDGYNLPEEMFFSKTLVELKIRSEHCVDWSNRAGRSFLPMLKTLDLDSEMIWLNTEIAKFLPYFPVLEELRVAITEWNGSDETVSSASLRKLSIHTTCCLHPVHPKSISFDTPNLIYFNYSDYVAEDYPLVNMKALFDAQINLFLDDDLTEQVRRPNNDLLYGNVGKLMNGIRHVQQLCFSADTMEVLSLCCDTMPVFNNLRSLIIKSDKDRGWQALPVLLRNCPRLDVLMFEGLLHYVTDKCGDACDCISQEEQGSLLASCPVRRIHIYKFGGTMKEINMIRHLMKSFTCLKEMGIFVEEDDPTEFEVPGKFELVEKILELYDEISSCDVHFLVPAFLRRKWTAQ